MIEGSLHIREVAENIGVVKLQIIQHRDMWRIMDELAALVEQRAVVLVALDHKRIGLRAEVVSHRRILWNATD